MKHAGTYDKVIILHGCPANATNIIPKSERWMNWISDRLKSLGFRAYAPDMPTPWAPRYPEWKKEFENYTVTADSLLIGHSCGAAFLVRWLLETNKRVSKLILVAPAKIPESPADIRQELYAFKLPSNAAKIADEIVIFTSNDLPHNLKSLEIYKKALKPRVVYIPEMVHFLVYTMKTNEFPELLREILS